MLTPLLVISNKHPWTEEPGWISILTPKTTTDEEFEQLLKDGWFLWIRGPENKSVLYRKRKVT